MHRRANIKLYVTLKHCSISGFSDKSYNPDVGLTAIGGINGIQQHGKYVGACT